MERIKKWLQQDDAALIFTPVNRRYLTGLESSLGYLFISSDSAVLYVDGRYFLAAKTADLKCDVALLTDISENLNTFVGEKGVKRVHLENNISVRELEGFKKMLSADVLTDTGLSSYIEELREVKTDYEVDCIIKAQRIAEKAFTEVLDYIKPGVSEREIAALLEYKCKCYGSEMPSFDTIVVAGKKTAMPHGVPDGNVIRAGDFVTIDFGAVYNGYHSDMTRTVAVGYATDKMYDVYNTVLTAMNAAKPFIAEGVQCKDVDKAARDVIEQKGYGMYFTHSTGHSVGLEIHESPSLSFKCEKRLKAGNVVTDEPGIYIDGEFGVRIEDMVFVTKDGNQTITKCENSLIII